MSGACIIQDRLVWATTPDSLNFGGVVNQSIDRFGGNRELPIAVSASRKQAMRGILSGGSLGAARLPPTCCMPPDGGCYPQHQRHQNQQKESRIFNPRDCGNAQRHDQTKQTDLPRKNMQAGSESTERKQDENRKTGRGSVENFLHAG